MKIFAGILINTIAVFIGAYFLSGVSVDGFISCLLVAVFLGLVNTFIKPFLKILTLPLNILTLGVFSLFLNAFIIVLASGIIPGFSVDNFLTAFIFSIVLSITSSVLSFFIG